MTARRVAPDGRLFTVDGFDLNGGHRVRRRTLQADFAVTTYSTPGARG